MNTFISDEQVDVAYKAALQNGAGQLTKADTRAALEAATKVRTDEEFLYWKYAEIGQSMEDFLAEWEKR